MNTATKLQLFGLFLAATLVGLGYWFKDSQCLPKPAVALGPSTVSLTYDATPLVRRHRDRVQTHCDLHFMNKYMASRTEVRVNPMTGLSIIIPEEHGGWGNMVLFNHMWRLFVAFLWDDIRPLTKHHRTDAPTFLFGSTGPTRENVATIHWGDYWEEPDGLTSFWFNGTGTVSDMAWRWKNLPSRTNPLSKILTEPPTGMFVPVRPRSSSKLLLGMGEFSGNYSNLQRTARGQAQDVPGCLSNYFVQRPGPELKALVTEMYSRLPPSVTVIGIHDRAGDACMWQEERGTQKRNTSSLDPSVAMWIRGDKRGDKRCTTHLKTFHEANMLADHIEEQSGSQPVFFVAADTQRALEDAKKKWPGRVLTVPGQPVQNQHYMFPDVTRQESKQFNFKTVADWFILTLCDVVVTGASSTFSSTATATGFNMWSWK